MKLVQKRGRTGTKILMKCHQCRQECQPKDGDWHQGGEGEIFLCRTCENRRQVGRPSGRLAFHTPIRRANILQ